MVFRISQGQPWVIHQNSQIFGEGVKRFRPENWSGKSKDVINKPPHYVRDYLDKQAMQSASAVQLAPKHVGVTIAESNISTSNGGMSDKPRVKARAGRLLRSIHRRSLTTTSFFHHSRNNLIQITRPLSIEGIGIAENRRFKLDRNWQTRLLYFSSFRNGTEGFGDSVERVVLVLTLACLT